MVGLRLKRKLVLLIGRRVHWYTRLWLDMGLIYRFEIFMIQPLEIQTEQLPSLTLFTLPTIGLFIILSPFKQSAFKTYMVTMLREEKQTFHFIRKNLFQKHCGTFKSNNNYPLMLEKMDTNFRKFDESVYEKLCSFTPLFTITLAYINKRRSLFSWPICSYKGCL